MQKKNCSVENSNSLGHKLVVLVLCGGPGAEREVSLASGRCVAAALRRGGYEVIEGDVTAEDLSALDCGGFDVVFPVLHGTFGEDGELQEIMERRGICFIGSGSASSRLAMDKNLAKEAFERAGLLTPRSALIKAGDVQSEQNGK